MSSRSEIACNRTALPLRRVKSRSATFPPLFASSSSIYSPKRFQRVAFIDVSLCVHGTCNHRGIVYAPRFNDSMEMTTPTAARTAVIARRTGPSIEPGL